MQKQRPMSRPPSIRIAFRTLGRTIRHGYDNLGVLLVVSIFWSLFMLPIFPVLVVAFNSGRLVDVLILMAVILIVPISPATAGLHRVTQRMTEARASSWGDFWAHFRADWGWSTRLIGLLVFGFLLIIINFLFYQSINNPILPFLTVFLLVVFIVWLGIMLFAIPLALRQEAPNLRITFRNSAILVLANLPGVIVSLLLLLITSIVFILPPLFLLWPGYVALWGEENARLLLVGAGLIPPDEFADAPRRSRS